MVNMVKFFISVLLVYTSVFASNNEKQYKEVVNDFKMGKTVNCKKEKINNILYILNEDETLFIERLGTNIIKIKTCIKIKGENKDE